MLFLYILNVIIGVYCAIMDIIYLIDPKKLHDKYGDALTDKKICLYIIIDWMCNLTMFSWGIYHILRL